MGEKVERQNGDLPMEHMKTIIRRMFCNPQVVIAINGFRTKCLLFLERSRISQRVETGEFRKRRLEYQSNDDNSSWPPVRIKTIPFNSARSQNTNFNSFVSLCLRLRSCSLRLVGTSQVLALWRILHQELIRTVM